VSDRLVFAQEAWGHDFGLVTEEKSANHLYMRTHGADITTYAAYKADEDRYLGMAFEVEDTASLEEAIEKFGAIEEDASNIPNAARAVSMTDPDGNQLLLVHGTEQRNPDAFRDDLVINTPFKKERLGRNQTWSDNGPAKLWKLGHAVLFVKSFKDSSEWYTERLGIIASDVYHAPNMPQVQFAGFFRLDKGDEYNLGRRASPSW